MGPVYQVYHLRVKLLDSVIYWVFQKEMGMLSN